MIIKCKHCAQVIFEVDNVWYDSGVFLQALCMSSNDPQHFHEPETDTDTDTDTDKEINDE